MIAEELIGKLLVIKKNVNFAENRNDARRVYKLLEENKLELEYEQNIFAENIFKIERSLLVEENRKTSCQTFIIALTKIINILEYNYRGKNYKTK
ncbi:hypothetical protein [Tenacibaculum finnmarkense]|uniref:hypothetical protein n=1 Tax=Tenacibaculum finnmarkense TaxID=2781243 RepID=UPI00187B9B62|nr:hypothetical protein [Tenacibaculum finnmarkense]MBE7661507.1 hypothetical protein [Tenacibaculum finnmarkense genomovar finnmarkense]MCG8253212.1 hypothetical protein [Tenacibaculum finnmarkense genomovar finnmarkense]MCG8816771.1 hypothetical protein [Tenacibaculum finnmarkense]MCG8821757.1 hypothetical protein [Tenacibaculum finnmarkense]